MMTSVGGGGGTAAIPNDGEGSTAVSDAITNPKSIGHLLMEEYTMNPSTPLPSFLEMNLVAATNASGRRTLYQILDGLMAKCDEISQRRSAVGGGAGDGGAGGDVGRSRVQRLQNHLASTLSHILHRYQSEIVLAATYMVERYSLQVGRDGRRGHIRDEALPGRHGARWGGKW